MIIADYSASYDDGTTHLRVAPGPHAVTLLFIRTGALPNERWSVPHYPGNVIRYARTPGGNIIITARAGGSSNLVYILDLRVGQISTAFFAQGHDIT
ncbi:MAG: hypothetical protein WDN04_23120 [Rhodospirillales bacterium]